MPNLYNVPTQNAIQRTLGNTLNASETATITFSTSVSGVLQASTSIPGILVVDRVDSNGNLTPSLTEYISFTGVSGSTVTGLVRGLAGTSDIAHSIGAIVEFVPDVTWADAINNTFTVAHNADGTHKVLSLLSLVSVNINNSLIQNSSINFASLASMTTSGRAYIPVETKLISTATSTFDFSFANIHSLTLSAATTTLSFANPIAGQALITRLGQDGTGGRRVVFPSTIYWAGGTAPTLTSTASKTDAFGFLCTASGFYDGYVVGMNL
jgi:hypothetical protein